MKIYINIVRPVLFFKIFRLCSNYDRFNNLAADIKLNIIKIIIKIFIIRFYEFLYLDFAKKIIKL